MRGAESFLPFLECGLVGQVQDDFLVVVVGAAQGLMYRPGQIGGLFRTILLQGRGGGADPRRRQRVGWRRLVALLSPHSRPAT